MQVQQLHGGMSLQPHERKVVADAVKGVKVRVVHTGAAVRVYRVNTLVDPADQLRFVLYDYVVVVVVLLCYNSVLVCIV